MNPLVLPLSFFALLLIPMSSAHAESTSITLYSEEPNVVLIDSEIFQSLERIHPVEIENDDGSKRLGSQAIIEVNDDSVLLGAGTYASMIHLTQNQRVSFEPIEPADQTIVSNGYLDRELDINRLFGMHVLESAVFEDKTIRPPNSIDYLLGDENDTAVNVLVSLEHWNRLNTSLASHPAVVILPEDDPKIVSIVSEMIQESILMPESIQEPTPDIFWWTETIDYTHQKQNQEIKSGSGDCHIVEYASNLTRLQSTDVNALAICEINYMKDRVEVSKVKYSHNGKIQTEIVWEEK